MFSATVSWPTAPVTKSLVLDALNAIEPPPPVLDTPDPDRPTLFWSTYDDIDHELVHSRRDVAASILASSYTFRKALIRKHFLSRCLSFYLAKNKDSPLRAAVPTTHEIELSFADELDEMLLDELYELGQALDKGRWWILKPGMADRGNGVRMFNSRDALTRIFEEFEEAESDEEEENEEDESKASTAVVTSQLRHFVIQEYLPNPLLLDPLEAATSIDTKPEPLSGRKFHLRAYCVASGSLHIYLFHKILALFSAVPYASPTATADDDGDPLPIDLGPHLTNTALQTDRGDENVRLLDELVGCHILSGPDPAEHAREFTKTDMQHILDQIVVVLAETFRAAVQMPTHFQPTSNAFELFGIDLLVSDTLQVTLLEVNAEPAIELTGPRLHWILRDLFGAMGKVCVQPFFASTSVPGTTWPVGETREGLIKCLDLDLRM